MSRIFKKKISENLRCRVGNLHLCATGLHGFVGSQMVLIKRIDSIVLCVSVKDKSVRQFATPDEISHQCGTRRSNTQSDLYEAIFNFSQSGNDYQAITKHIRVHHSLLREIALKQKTLKTVVTLLRSSDKQQKKPSRL